MSVEPPAAAKQTALDAYAAALDQREAERQRARQLTIAEADALIARSPLPTWWPGVEWDRVDIGPSAVVVRPEPERDFHVMVTAAGHLGGEVLSVRIVQRKQREDASNYWAGPIVATLAEVGAVLTRLGVRGPLSGHPPDEVQDDKGGS